MACRQVVFVNNEVYHVFNRGVEKRTTFMDKRDYRRFLETACYYQQISPPTRFSFRKRGDEAPAGKSGNLVEIVCYCLMPNHFHFLLRQIADDGISRFAGQLANSYTRYFNTKHRRTGHLFQGPFRSVRIRGDNLLKHVSRYIHLNPVTGLLAKNPEDYLFSSYREYVGRGRDGVCQKEVVLDLFSAPEGYRRFVSEYQDHKREMKDIQRYIFDESEE